MYITRMKICTVQKVNAITDLEIMKKLKRMPRRHSMSIRIVLKGLSAKQKPCIIWVHLNIPSNFGGGKKEILIPYYYSGLYSKLKSNFDFRALWERPGYYNIRQGMVKAQSAIENTLSKGMSFMDLKDIIVAIINDPDIDLGYEYAPQEDDSVFRITEDDDLLKDLFYTIREESEEEYKSLPTSDEPGTEAEKVSLSLL